MNSQATQTPAEKVKCLVWDLDHTLWDGILSEGDGLSLRPGIMQALALLDQRGIVQSIASKNDHDLAWEKLQQLGVDQYFLYPQIHWQSKAQSLQQIAQDLNIGIDSLAFIDDQAFERAEVAFHLPMVRVYDALQWDASLFEQAEFVPRFITQDSKRRRAMYQSERQRKQLEQGFGTSSEAFLQSLDMELTIAPAQEDDLQRAEELTLRTHQLNTTGLTYSYEELDQLRQSDRHRLLIAELNDKLGTYGKIGLILLELEQGAWVIRLLLMSCRVMSRGIGGTLINFLRAQAAAQGVRLLADFRPTERNRMMYITYKFAGFSEIEASPDCQRLEADLSDIAPTPRSIRLIYAGQ
ncbi:MAG: HAD-IIIC family phosphatase [Gammaproteobacteria bacterium SHHR-1]|uniref:HAD-IIIC family phosphatase n=1 Tax=Magnetovirga frankeli TaxID=947516 RepID=UPI001292D22A|nr:HAD-IIIC family phosphatase [gamma proteobacterium SS-5]